MRMLGATSHFLVCLSAIRSVAEIHCVRGNRWKHRPMGKWTIENVKEETQEQQRERVFDFNFGLGRCVAF